MIPEKYNHTIWDITVIEPKDGAFVLAKDVTVGEAGDDYKWSGILLSFTLDTEQNFRPVLFQSPINAELYRQFLLETEPEHPVKDYEVKFMRYVPTNEGYLITQRFGVCPNCGAMASHGDAQTDTFYCEHCETAFSMNPEPESR